MIIARYINNHGEHLVVKTEFKEEGEVTTFNHTNIHKNENEFEHAIELRKYFLQKDEMEFIYSQLKVAQEIAKLRKIL